MVNIMKHPLKISALVLALAGVVAAGADAKANWEKYCKGCHGVEGKGDTKLGQKFECRDYSDAKVQATLTDEKMFKSIKDGLTKGGEVQMKPYSDKLTDQEIKDLVAFIRKLKK